MRAHTSPHVGVKAAGGVRTLDALIDVMNLGVTRIGATATAAIIDDFRARSTGQPSAAAAAGGGAALDGTTR
jgi:deoxyribose-phosphate aldolase